MKRILILSFLGLTFHGAAIAAAGADGLDFSNLGWSDHNLLSAQVGKIPGSVVVAPSVSYAAPRTVVAQPAYAVLAPAPLADSGPPDLCTTAGAPQQMYNNNPYAVLGFFCRLSNGGGFGPMR